ncbi:MAG: FecR domain-containing protein [Cytophagales bacterium]|nr:FecR domain-containing protein [Cytophagales bacterium]
MKDTPDPRTLIDKFLRRDCTPEERQQLARYLREHPDPELLRLLEEDWQTFRPAETLDATRSAAILRKALGKPAAAEVPVAPAGRVIGWRPHARAAAVVLVLLVAGGWWLVPKARRAAFTTYHAAGAQQRRVQLSEGSTVHLNGHSTLRYRVNFWSGAREAQLTGEGFFTVARRNGQPFVVTTRHATVRVLGTQFNVKEDPAGRRVWVAVAGGKVAFRSLGAEGDGVPLTANQLGWLRPDGTVAVENEPVANYLSWMDGRWLAFRDTPLPVVVRQLERLYGVPVRLEAESLGSLRLTATARRDALPQLLDKITLSLGISYEATPQGFVLRP